MFLAFQQPESIAGVPVIQFLRQALSARRGIDMSALEIRLMMMEWMDKLGMDPAFGERHLNDGFSGGEKKRNEILQMAILEPEVAVLDETDSGLDVDALRAVARGVHTVREARPELGRPGDHPLPAHARRAGRRPGARAGRRGHRRRRRPRARRAARDRRVRRMATVSDGRPRARRRPDPEGLPPAGPGGARAPHHLSRLGGVLAAAGAGARRHARVRGDDPRQRAPGGLRHRRGGDPALRGRPAQRRVGSSVRPIRRGRWCSPRTPPRPSTWWPTAGARSRLEPGDAIVLTEMEHHANIVPWHMLAAERDLTIRWIPIDDDGRLVLDRPRASSWTGPSWSGSPACRTCSARSTRCPRSPAVAHDAGAVVVADGAQSVPHLPTDVGSLGVDFLAFSAHKMLGPTGIGVLWGREDLLAAMPPFLGGGEMILDVTQGRFHSQRHPVAVRGRDSAHRRGHRPGGGGRLPPVRRHGPRCAPTRSP